MMESQCSGLVSSEILRRARQNRTRPEDTIQTAELAKWQAVELFKVDRFSLQRFDLGCRSR